MPVTAGARAESSSRGGRWVRRLIAVVVAAVLLLGVLWLAAAWYFSDVLYRDGLQIKPPPVEPVTDVKVVAVEEHSITLLPGADSPTEPSAPGAWGVWWEGGYGELGEIRDASGDAVTRAFEVVYGSPPPVGSLVDVDKYLYGDSPSEVLGLDWDEVPITTPLGEQDAWFVPADSAEDTWAILVHGKGSDRDELLRLLKVVHEAGLPALVITYRGDRDQPMDPSGVYGFGATEWPDLDAAVAYARDHGARDLVLAGASTGAAIIGSWLDNAADTESVAGLVLDSPNADVEATFAYGASQRTVPGIGVPLPRALAWTAFRLAELRFPLDFSDVDFSDTLADAPDPLLVFQGAGDRTVPVEATRDLVAEREAAGLETTYVETAAGEHVGSYNHDPAAYESALLAFLEDLEPAV